MSEDNEDNEEIDSASTPLPKTKTILDHSIFNDIEERFGLNAQAGLSDLLAGAFVRSIKQPEHNVRVIRQRKVLNLKDIDNDQFQQIVGKTAFTRYHKKVVQVVTTKSPIYDYEEEDEDIAQSFEEAFIEKYEEAAIYFTKQIAESLAITSALNSVVKVLIEQEATRDIEVKDAIGIADTLTSVAVIRSLAKFLGIPETEAVAVIMSRNSPK